MIASSETNIASSLSRAAAARPSASAIVDRKSGRRLTFRELDAESARCAAALRSAGVARGERVVVMVPPGPDFFTLAFGLFRLGALPVLIDPGMGRAPLGRCVAEAAPTTFVGIAKAQAAARVLGWGRATLKRRVLVGPRLPGLGTPLETLKVKAGPVAAIDTAADEPAAILFTSGSTGAPKGTLYSHGEFASQLELIRSHFGTREGETDVPTFPLFALFDPALGMTAVLPDMDFTRPGSVAAEEIVEVVRSSGATRMFGSPAVLDRLGRAGLPLPGVRRVVSAGAPLAPKILARFLKTLDAGAEVRTAYGATEALPVASISADEILRETAAVTARGGGVCVGRPVDGVAIFIAPISDEPLADWTPLPAGSVGEVVVSGPSVTQAYFGRPRDTALAKVRLAGGRLGHRMGDLGRLDAAGRLWLCGRKSHRVVTENGPLFTLPCEGLFNVHPKVKRTALVGVGERPRQRPVLCVELEPGERPSKELARELLALGASAPFAAGICDVLFHPSFPVDVRHNAKIFREKLAVWAEGRL